MILKMLDFKNDMVELQQNLQTQTSEKLVQKTFTRKENKKQEHLYFLRTHKCGSSTLYSIFLRFGYRNKLTFVLPPSSSTISVWPFQEGQGYYRIPKGENYEILCHHTTYNRENLEKVLPKDTMYIGLVREPFSHFVSAFIYFRKVFELPSLMEIPGKDIVSSISWYLGHPSYVDQNHSRKGSRDMSWTYTRNGMAYDFGFPINDIRNASRMKIDKFVKKLDVEFDLVMVLEHIDESLVLMRRMLRWSMKDILYISHRNEGVINSTDVKSSLTDIDRQRHREWESIDFALYNHFLVKLLLQIVKEGASFQKELADFKLAKRAAMQYCMDKKFRENLRWTVESTDEEIMINSYDCRLLQTHGKAFTPLIKQTKKYTI